MTDEKKSGSILAAWCLLTALGIYFLVVSTTYSGVHTGTLYASGRVYQKNSKGGGSYYVKEYFYKDNNQNDTCIVTRPQSYSTVKEVNRAKDKVKLYTKRTIWSYRYDKSICYDNNIKKQNFILGICLLSISNGIPLLLLIFFICYIFYEAFRCNCNFGCVFPVFYHHSSVEVHRGKFHDSIAVPADDPENGGNVNESYQKELNPH